VTYSFLIVTEKFDIGGLETRIAAEVDALRHQGHNVHIACGPKFNHLLAPELSSLLTADLQMSPDSTANDLIDTVDRLRSIIVERQVDFVIAHPFGSLIPAAIAAELEAKPLISVLHGPISIGELYGPLFEFFFFSVLLPQSSLVVAVSEETRDLITPYTAPNTLVVCKNTLNFRQPAFKRSAESRNQGDWLVVSRLDDAKAFGIFEFLKLADKCAVNGVRIVGDGTAKDWLVQQVAAAGFRLEVKFLGQRGDVRELMLTAGTVVGMGRVVLEGVAAGKPVCLIGYDGTKGMLTAALFPIAAYANFSGRNLPNVNAEQLRTQIESRDDHGLALYELASTSHDCDREISLLVSRLEGLTATGSGIFSEVYRLLASCLIDSNVPFIRSISLFDKLGRIVNGSHLSNSALVASYGFQRQRFDQANLNYHLSKQLEWAGVRAQEAQVQLDDLAQNTETAINQRLRVQSEELENLATQVLHTAEISFGQRSEKIAANAAAQAQAALRTIVGLVEGTRDATEELLRKKTEFAILTETFQAAVDSREREWRELHRHLTGAHLADTRQFAERLQEAGRHTILIEREKAALLQNMVDSQRQLSVQFAEKQHALHSQLHAAALNLASRERDWAERERLLVAAREEEAHRHREQLSVALQAAVVLNTEKSHLANSAFVLEDERNRLTESIAKAAREEQTLRHNLRALEAEKQQLLVAMDLATLQNTRSIDAISESHRMACDAISARALSSETAVKEIRERLRTAELEKTELISAANQLQNDLNARISEQHRVIDALMNRCAEARRIIHSTTTAFFYKFFFVSRREKTRIDLLLNQLADSALAVGPAHTTDLHRTHLETHSTEQISERTMNSKTNYETTVHSVDDLLELSGNLFIESAYRHVLGRPADISGLHHYLERLRRGTSKESVVAQLRNSREGLSYGSNLPGLEQIVRREKRSRLPLIGSFIQKKQAVGQLNVIENKVGNVESLLLSSTLQINAKIDELASAQHAASQKAARVLRLHDENRQHAATAELPSPEPVQEVWVPANSPTQVQSRKYEPIIKEQLVVLTGVPYDDVGGGQRSAQLARCALKAGREVIYIYAYQKYDFVLNKHIESDIEMLGLHHLFIDRITPHGLLDMISSEATIVVEFPHPKILPFLKTARIRGIKTIFELIDDWETSLGGDWFELDVYRQFVRESDVVIGTAKLLVERLHQNGRTDALYLPNAGNEYIFDKYKTFDRPYDIPWRNARRALYFGSLYGEWFGWDYVIESAKVNPDLDILLIGDYPAQENFPSNIHFLGAKNIDELPAYLQHTDFAILPFVPGKISDAVSPIKIFEYLFMGKPVVATRLPEIVGYPDVHICDTVAEFSTQCATIASNGVEGYDERENDTFISENSWHSRLDILMESPTPSPLAQSVSAVILIHNNAKIIGRCLRSLQLHGDKYLKEIIVVDNDSVDGGAAYVEQNFPSARVIRNSVNGCSSGRNLGASIATGKYLVFFDSDQWFTSASAFEEALSILNSNARIGAIGWGAGWFDKNRDDLGGMIADYCPNRAMTDAALRTGYRNDIGYLATCGFFLPKSVFEATGGFDTFYDPTCFEDTDLSFLVKQLGFDICYRDLTGIRHQPHQTTKANDNNDVYRNLFLKNSTYFKKKWSSHPEYFIDYPGV
jgi:GT2 family glycosyltransferase/glycosyltransferase involved in cell wall biosynthesis